MSTNTSNQVGKAVVASLTATGSSQATALQLAPANSIQEITTVASSTGVRLPLPKLGVMTTIVNAGVNTLSVYPQLGGTVDNGTVNVAATIAAGKSATYTASSGSNWYTESTTAASGGGSGTVTSVSVVSANGFAGTVATATTTPAITLSTSITGLLKGNGTAIAAAVSDTDYQAPITLTTSGSSGAATFSSNTLNIPQYSGGGSGITGLTGDVETAQSTSGNVAAMFFGQTNVITPSIAASQNNWSPTGWLTSGTMVANLIRTSVTASGVNLTGLIPPSSGTIDGVIVTIENAIASTYPVRLVASSASSTAANRFNLLSDVFLDPGESLVLQYDNAGSRWRELHPHRDYRTDVFGSAADGSVTASTSSLTRTMFYDNLTIPASTALTCEGFDIFVNGILDISAASAGSIVYNGAAGSAGTLGGAGGAGGSAVNATGYILPAQISGIAGGGGAVNTGTSGNAPTGRNVFNPLVTGSGGTGGSGGSGAGGSNGGVATPIQMDLPYRINVPLVWPGGLVLAAGSEGGGAAGGTGDSTNSGGGGGGGGAAGGFIRIFARKINRGSNSSAAIIQAKGGAGAIGGAGAATGNTGGGGGGCGGGGGGVLIYHAGLFGSQISGAIDVSGGAGGNGGALHGTGTAGSGGSANPGGYAQLMDVRSGAVTAYNGGARGLASGSIGGTAAVSQLAI